MNTSTIIESGLQVITRLNDRPLVQNIDNDIFFNKLESTDIIEISSVFSSGIYALLTKFITKCILPLQYNGLDIDVLFINTENQFKISYLIKVITAELHNIHGSVNVNELIKTLLTNLKIINCYNYQQFLLTLNSLENILLKYKKVGFIIIDSISAYFWLQKDELSYNSYLIRILNIIKNMTIEFKTITLYTKQFNFISKKQTIEWNERKKIIRYEICLCKNESTNQFICSIKSENQQKQLYYRINGIGIEWMKEGN